MEETKKYIVMCYSSGGCFYKVMNLSIKELMNWSEFFHYHSKFESWDADVYYIWEFNEENLKYAMWSTGECECEFMLNDTLNEPENLINRYTY